MRLSQLFGRTLRQVAAVQAPALELALRAGLVRTVEDKIVLLPLGTRVLRRMSVRLASRLAGDPQEVVLPPGRPADGWCELVRSELQSYKQIPRALYAQRNLTAPVRAIPLSRPDTCTAVQWVVAAENEEAFSAHGDAWRSALEAWLKELGLQFVGSEGLGQSVQWHVPHPMGSEELLVCGACGHSGVADTMRIGPPASPEQGDMPLRLVETPGAMTIASLCDMLEIPEQRTLKALFLQSRQRGLVVVLLRGDRNVSSPKLSHALGDQVLGPASEEDIRAVGAEPGYGSPIGLAVASNSQGSGVLVVGDHSIVATHDSAAGANRPGFHYLGVNHPRDFQVTCLADLAQARPGDACAQCTGALEARQAISIATWDILHDAFEYADATGATRPGIIGLGSALLEPTMAAVIAAHADDQGIEWPSATAPFDVHIVSLGDIEAAPQLYRALEEAGYTVLFDDRELSAGAKFADADLIGCPVRVTVSRRSLEQGGAEVSGRRGTNRVVFPPERIVAAIRDRLWPSYVKSS